MRIEVNNTLNLCHITRLPAVACRPWSASQKLIPLNGGVRGSGRGRELGRLSWRIGVSEGLVSKIVKEGKVAEQTGTKVRTPGKSRKRSTGFIVVDDFDMGVIRRKQHEFYDDHRYCKNI
ncbi:Uncharacterized protein OBRU01_13305 [Operophtera brumata]|uniref:Uncharacterized protein n=1 Tax=Operophtera brumata TaxID=104452 RepID=A0A0L7KUW4_OPEBR|nr:Uncharacterized protein OBRU01_13305 [Operophtera brumata]